MSYKTLHAVEQLNLRGGESLKLYMSIVSHGKTVFPQKFLGQIQPLLLYSRKAVQVEQHSGDSDNYLRVVANMELSALKNCFKL